MLVAIVAPDGALNATQLPSVPESQAGSAPSVLEHIKAAMPSHSRVQALNSNAGR